MASDPARGADLDLEVDIGIAPIQQQEVRVELTDARRQRRQVGLDVDTERAARDQQPVTGQA